MMGELMDRFDQTNARLIRLERGHSTMLYNLPLSLSNVSYILQITCTLYFNSSSSFNRVQDKNSPDRTSPDRTSLDITSPDKTSLDITSPDKITPDITSLFFKLYKSYIVFSSSRFNHVHVVAIYLHQ
jgi:hypothetical protein